MATPLTLDLYVNNQFTTVTVADGTEPLLYVLRNQVGTKGVKFGCGVAQCGACTVIINGVTKRSCVTPLNPVAEGAQVTTIEGLGRPNNRSGEQEDGSAQEYKRPSPTTRQGNAPIAPTP